VAKPVVSSHAIFPGSIQGGVAPSAVADALQFIAPAGEGLTTLLMRRRLFQNDVRVTTPRALATAVIAACAASVADRAANRLPDQAPLASYRGPLTQTQAVALIVLLLVAVLAFVHGGTFDVVSLALGPLFLAMVGLRLAALKRSQDPGEPHRTPGHNLPVYTVIVVLHREARVLPQLIEALRCLDYPALWSKCTKGC
jgi:hypothetical protein